MNAKTIISPLLALCGVLALTAGPLLAAPGWASTLRAFPPRPSSIESALIFDYAIPAKQLVQDEASEHVGYVWGANAPEPRGGHTRHDYYVAWAQGWCPGRGLPLDGKCPRGGPPSFPWLRAHHPNWILWKVNKRGVPTGPARSKYNPGPILDFTNPAVQQYWMAHYIAPYLRLGFSGIGWDGPMSFNPYGAAGHFDTKHHFIRQYSGYYQDIRWASAQTQALGQLLALSRAINPNVQFALDQFLDCTFEEPLWALPLRFGDTIVDEEAYSGWGVGGRNFITSAAGRYCADQWLEKTDTYIHIQKAGKHLVLINEEPYRVYPYMTNTNKVARADLQWALANYLLIKYSHTYFWFGGAQQYGHAIFEQRELAVDLGQAYGDMHSDQGVYVRWFTKGVALVNPNASLSFTVTLQHGKYRSIYGWNVNRVTMAPHAGLVLLRKR